MSAVKMKNHVKAFESLRGSTYSILGNSFNSVTFDDKLLVMGHLRVCESPHFPVSRRTKTHQNVSICLPWHIKVSIPLFLDLCTLTFVAIFINRLLGLCGQQVEHAALEDAAVERGHSLLGLLGKHERDEREALDLAAVAVHGQRELRQLACR